MDMRIRLSCTLLVFTSHLLRSATSEVTGQQATTDTSSRRLGFIGERRTCSGSENGMGKVTYESGSIKRLRDIYTNCSIVTGNLEIVGITGADLNKEGLQTSLDFFDKIEEVTGYVLIASNALNRLSFPKLRIIWGNKQFIPQQDGTTNNGTPNSVGNFSLFVVGNGLDYVDMRSLRAVVEGRVGIVSNSRLCHWKTGSIDWTQILGNDYQSQNRFMADVDQTDECFKTGRDRTCSPECEHGNCWWSDGPEFCQQIYRKNCAPQCINGMCFNQSNPLSCCSAECAAGCSGPTNRDCYGCRMLRDEGTCVDKCPAKELYNVKTAEYEQNPNGKFSWNRECVKQCPEHMVVYKDGCVARCPEGHFTEENDSICKPCNGPCPKTCDIDKPVNALNLDKFVNCTVINGMVEIREDTFDGGADYVDGKFLRYRGLAVEELEVLSGIQRITHFLFVQSTTLQSLWFLRNLKQIDGRKKSEDRWALSITGSQSLTELGLHSLTRIMDGDVLINGNNRLCLVDTLPWKTIAPTVAVHTRNNRPWNECIESGISCDELCENATGCWGVGTDMCYSCQYYEMNRTCARDCPQSEHLYAIGKKCDHCHTECNECRGPGPYQCISCKNVQLDGACVSECPSSSHYEFNKRCSPCHAHCFDNGCTGPGNYVGQGGCKRCRFAVVDPNSNKVMCLPELSSSQLCRGYSNLTDYYLAAPPASLRTVLESWACLKCNSVCKSCDGPGVDDKVANCECRQYRFVDPLLDTKICVAKCERNTFAKMTIESPNQPIDCYPCHQECDTCYGSESTQCYSCKTYTDYLNPNRSTFNCTSRCPQERRFVYNGTCTSIDPTIEASRHQRMKEIGLAAGVAVFAVIMIVISAFIYMKFRRYKAATYLQPQDEIFEMNPDAKPNLARLRLIIETELRKGGALGRGAFGDVFKGVWCPSDVKAKYPVAIKVLHNATAAAEKEMLTEAGIMASMEHPFLLPLKGVCVGSQLMLITPLVPLGNLLDYVQNNKAKIGSAALLRWCMQIASGMSYLEEKRLVHRDLAARNVLVQTPYRIRITDFGLAKMLDYGEDELKISGEKMPIKWLALECIQFKRYTHKSDVWAYGVTVWELLTFGEKPYRDVALHNIPMLLEKGERLSQPKICTLDVYMILIKCWMVDADTRPSFKELTETFARMMKDPGRYLVIEGDALLRLPAYTANDHKQMLEQLVDDPDVRDSDDLFSNTNLSPATPLSPSSPSNVFWGSGCATDSLNGTPNLREPVGRVRCGQRQQSTSSHRYASDPLKKTGIFSGIGKPEDLRSIPSPTTDIDNYLVPDSHFGSLMSPGSPDGELAYTQLVENEQPEGGAPDSEYYHHLRAAISGAVENEESRFDGLDNRVYIMQSPSNNNLESLRNRNHKASDDSQQEQAAQEAKLDVSQSMTETESVV